MYYKTAITRDSIAMVLLAKRLKANPISLLLLHDRYKKDIYYFWYLLTGVEGLPDAKELYKILHTASKYLDDKPQWLLEHIKDNFLVFNLEDKKV